MTIYSLDVLLSQFCSMFGSNCCFLSCLQASQETGKVVWYSHLYKDFPQLAVIHTVRGFSIVNEAKVIFFLNPCFFYDPTDVGNVISSSSAFSKSSLYIWKKFSVHLLLKTSLKGLSIILLACEMSAIVQSFEHFFGIALLWDWNENWPFPVLWPLLSFPNLLAYWMERCHSIIF